MAQTPNTRTEKAYAEQRKQARSQANREWAIVFAVLAVVAALVVGALLVTGGDDDTQPATPEATDQVTEGPAPEVAAVPDAQLNAEVTPEGGYAFGDPAAPHRVVIYEDFICPFCGQLEATISDRLSDLITSGGAVVEYRPLNFLTSVGPYSLAAANAMAVVMDTAGPDVALAFHDELFADQPSEREAAPGDDWLIEKAVAAGADEDAVRPGIEEQTFAGWVNQATGTALGDAGIEQTPTVIVDDQHITTGSTIEELADAIIEAATAG